MEEKRSISSYFITLTYDPKHLPHSRNNFRTLRAQDLQLFFKRLRKHHSLVGKRKLKRRRNYDFISSLKYYAVGEYGGKFKRPHYHIILFNADMDCIAKAWTKGTIHYGRVEAASVGYVLKYVSDVAWKPLHANDDREPQFSRMSKNLGDNYLTKKMIQWHMDKLTDRCYCNIDGYKIAMPRYYKLKMYTQGERKYIGETISNKLLKKQLGNGARKFISFRDAQERAKGIQSRHEFRSKLNA